MFMPTGISQLQRRHDGAASGVPVIEGWTGQSVANSSSINLVAPSGIVAGDLLVIVVMCNMGDTYAFVAGNLTGPSGFTRRTLYGDGGAVDGYVAVYTKTADGSEGNRSASYLVAKDWAGWYLRISGANTAAPVNVHGGSTFTGGTTINIAGVMTTVDDCLAFYALENWGSTAAPFSVSGAGWAELDEEAAGSSNDIAGCIGTREQTSAGATGTASVTCSSSSHGAYCQFAIAPA